MAARLVDLRREFREGQPAFAKRLGVPQSSLASWESGGRPITKATMLKIAEHAPPGERDYWLRQAGVDLAAVDQLVTGYKRTFSFLDGDRLVVPIRTGAISAGQPLSLSDNEYEGSLALPISKAADTGKLIGARVRGDSMAPRILEGDIVVIDTRLYAPEENAGHIVAAADDDGKVTIKVLENINGGYFLVAHNPSFEPRIQPVDVGHPWSIAGRVVGWLGFPTSPKKRK